MLNLSVSFGCYYPVCWFTLLIYRLILRMKPVLNSLNFWGLARMNWKERYHGSYLTVASHWYLTLTLKFLWVHWFSKSYHILPVVLIQISKCLGKNFQPNGHGVDAKDLAEKMQRLSTEVSTSANVRYLFSSCVSPVPFKTLFVIFRGLMKQLKLELQVLCHQQIFSARPQRKTLTFRSQCHVVKFLLWKSTVIWYLLVILWLHWLSPSVFKTPMVW